MLLVSNEYLELNVIPPEKNKNQGKVESSEVMRSTHCLFGG